MDVSVNSNEHRGLQVACALLGIVAGSIIIGVSNSSGAATVGGIFLGAAGIGLLIAIAPLLQVWQNLGPGRCRVQPLPPTAEGHRQDNEVNEVKEFAAGETAGPSSINDGSSAPAPDLISKS